MRRLEAFLLFVSLATTACKSTLKLNSGQQVPARVETADRDYVYVVLDEPKTAWEAYDRAQYAQARLGHEGQRGDGERLYRVPRAALADVTPPGRALAIIGTVFVTLGPIIAGAGLLLAEGDREFGGAYRNFAWIACGVSAGGGLVPLITGWAIYGNAAARARPSASSTSRSGEGGLPLVIW